MAGVIHKSGRGQGHLGRSSSALSHSVLPCWARWQAQPFGKDLLGRMGCVFAHALLTPLLKEQIQRYFILCTFV